MQVASSIRGKEEKCENVGNLRGFNCLPMLEELGGVVAEFFPFLVRVLEVCSHSVLCQVTAKAGRNPGRMSDIIDQLCGFWLGRWYNLES